MQKIVLAGLIGAGFALAGCDQSGTGGDAGAGGGDKVVQIYNWSDYIGETTLEDFTKATGIKAKYDVYDSNDVLEAKLLVGKSGYDVVVPTAQPFLSRQIKQGLYQKLDKSKIPNIKNLDPKMMEQLAGADPGNEYAVIYQWGTNGIGYNEAKINERMPDAPVESFDMILNPDIIKKFADCGVTMLDSATEILPIVLNYLGKDPNSTDPADLKAAEDHMMKLRPYIKYFHSSQYINDLANGDVCLSLGWSGDVIQAAARAEEASNGQTIVYHIPKEGTIIWFDTLAVPADAPHPEEAFAFINFVLDPEVMAGITNYVAYANAVPGSLEFIDDEIKGDETIYPPADVQKRLFVVKGATDEIERARADVWTHIRAGQ